MLDVVSFLAGVALLAIPGVCLWRVLFPRDAPIECWTWGATTGLALAVLAAFYLAHLRLWLFWPVWLALAALAVGLAWSRRSSSAQTGHERAELWLALLLVVVAVSRFAPVFLRDTPPGWDPSFHLILIRKLALTDRIVRDWTPFESVPLNYPLGSHLLVAVLARLTRLPLPRAFQLLIPALGVISTAQVYALAQRVFRRPELSLYAALAYGAWAFAGSIGYYTWGGLPNQLGVMFLLGLLAVAVDSQWDRRSTAPAAVLLAAIFVTHHHVLLVAVAAIVATVVHWLTTSTDEAWKKTRGLVLAAGTGAALAFPYLIPHILRAAEIRDTGVLRFTEPHSFASILVEMGIVVVGCGTAGIIVCRHHERKQAGVLLAVASALLLLYVLFGPLYRAYSLHRWGHEYVAFTPSRFLTDLACFLSIFAGYAVYRAADHFRLRPGVVLTVGLLVALTNVPLWMEVFAREPQAERRQAYAWIEQHTPADAIVLTQDEWAPYATWRRTPSTPLPVSEPRTANNAARDAADALALGRSPNVAVVVKVVAPGGVAPRGTVLWKTPAGWSVVQLWPETRVGGAASDVR